jgi:hypothetical protein
MFFTEKYRIDPRREPLKYYLRKTTEPSLLFYRWRVADYKIAMFESDVAVLLEITTKEGKAVRPKPDELATFLRSMLNIETTQDELSKQLKLTGRLNEGDVVTNAADLGFIGYNDWLKTIVAFGSKRGLCVFLLKAPPGRASKQLHGSPEWLSNEFVFPKMPGNLR